MTPLEEARAFQAEVTKGGSRQKGRPSARGRGGAGRGRGGLPSTPPRSPFARGGRGGGGHGGSLLQRATSRAVAQPAPVTQEQSGLPSTPSFTPQKNKPRPHAIPIVPPPSANSGLTLSVSPSGIETSIHAPQAAPKDTAPASGPNMSQAPATRASSSIEESYHSAGPMAHQWQPRLHTVKARGGRRLRMSRFATKEEDDEVWAFWNDDKPVPVGQVRYYQEEYEQTKKTNELQKPSSSNSQHNAPKRGTEVLSAATCRTQSEPSTADKKTKDEIKAKKEPAKLVMASSPVSTAKALSSLAPTLAKALAHPRSGKSGLKNGVNLPLDNSSTTADHKDTPEKEGKVQSKAEAEKSRGKGEAEMTTHDKSSSSVGVLGCKINVDRKAHAKLKEGIEPKKEANAVIKPSDEVNVEVSGEPAPVDSKTPNAQELERVALLLEREKLEQQLAREIEEEEAALAEMAKQIAIKKANAKRLMKARAAKLDVSSASADAPCVFQQVTNTGSTSNDPYQGASAAVSFTPSTSNFGGAQSTTPVLTENTPAMVNEGGFDNHTSVLQNTGGTLPNTASNSMDDLMDLDFNPATMQYVPHSTQISPLGFSNGHSSFGNGLQEAEEEEEL
ncbi:hypothetical protein QBC45DRAFT_481814 [Copromyces sp. CBS 386.78]|nr:hypothetical protein QBC45DRAFT_481814 [Copromyces sp. CBS 386.78]